MKDFRDDVEGGYSESEYERVARTKEHLFCMWNDQGERCQGPATVFTVVLATQAMGQNMSVLRGGYCRKHFVGRRDGGASSTAEAAASKDWRDVLVRAVTTMEGAYGRHF